MNLADVIPAEDLIAQAGQRQQLRDADLPLKTTASDELTQVYARMQLEEANEALLFGAAILRRHRACKKAGLR